MATQAGMTIGQITDEEIARVKSRIGSIIRPYRYNTTATEDAIRHFCDGIGDDNPLYRDFSYANQTRYGHIMAPPCFLYSVYWPSGTSMGFPGVHGFHSGNDWEFYKVIHAGDTISVIDRLVDVIEKPSRFAGRMILQHGEAVYRNQRGEMIAKVRGWTIRTERQAGKEKGKYKQIEKYKYTPEELKAIDKAYLKEETRGSTPRYWEDVSVADELEPLVKGPLNITDMHAFIAGCLGGAALGRGGAHKFLAKYRLRHPAWARFNPETGTVDIPEQVHVADSFAGEIGLPSAYDYGCQRICWLGNLLTNWMGDDGFLKKFFAELRLFNMLGDTTWLKGKVTRKYIENGEHLVDIDCWGENQRGQVTMPGHATIVLPSKSV